MMFWACLNHLMEHELSKLCQYIIINDKVAQGFNFTSIKSTQVDIPENMPKEKWQREASTG
jgi:hypothetical protein